MNQGIPPVPPVQSVQLAETPSKWPTVFGVIGIILAALGVLGSCCGAISPLVWPRYIQWLEGMEGVTEEQIAMAKAGMLPAAWMVPASLVGLVMSVILMIGAIRLLRRLSSGVGLCKFWAWFTGVGLPLFALYWFMREPVRAEIVLWDEERRGVI
jgi:hypothetical protein